MQIYIATVEREAMLIEISAKAKVSDLKNEISTKLVDIKLNDQILKFDAKILHDSDTIQKSGIMENSVIELLINRKNAIFLKLTGGDNKTHELEVDFDKNTNALKKQISQLLNIPTECQRLYITEIKNNDVLCNKMIGPGTTLHLYVLDEINVILNIVDVSAKFPIELIEIPKTHKINLLKKLISAKWGIPCDHLSISYNDQILDNKKKIGTYNNIPNMSNVFVKQINIEIFIDVSALGQNVIKLEALLTDKAKLIKNIIKKRFKISKQFQKLIFNDTVLSNRDILTDKGIVSGSILNLIPIVQPFKIKILFGMLEDVIVETHIYETIVQLKQIIELVTYIPSEQQKLSMDRTELQNDKQLRDYDIKEGTKIIMDRLGTFELYIKTVTGFNINIRVHESDQIRFVRYQLSKLDKRWGVLAHEHAILYRGTLLNDDRTLSTYGIKPNSKLLMAKITNFK